MDKSIRREKDIVVLYREQHALYAFLVGFWLVFCLFLRFLDAVKVSA